MCFADASIVFHCVTPLLALWVQTSLSVWLLSLNSTFFLPWCNILSTLENYASMWEPRRSMHNQHTRRLCFFFFKWSMIYVIWALIIFMHLKNVVRFLLVLWGIIGSTVVKMCGWIKEKKKIFSIFGDIFFFSRVSSSLMLLLIPTRFLSSLHLISLDI